MKNLKVKNVLFSLFAVIAFAVFLTSCEQTEVISTELNEVIEQPQGLVVLSENAENQTTDSHEIESRASCNCRHMGSSDRNSTSSYVYCYGNNGISKTFILKKSNGQHVGTRTGVTGYYTYFTGLQPGQTYKYQVRMTCPDGSYYCSYWKYFTHCS